MFTGGYTIFLCFFFVMDRHPFLRNTTLPTGMVSSHLTHSWKIELENMLDPNYTQVTQHNIYSNIILVHNIAIFSNIIFIATNHSQPAHPLKPKIFAVPHGEPSAQCAHGAVCFCWAAWWQDVATLGHRKIHDSNQLDLCSDIYVELRSWNFSLEHELFF